MIAPDAVGGSRFDHDALERASATFRVSPHREDIS
jgi:hypothetical protein